MNGGGENNDFFEEKCAPPMRRGNAQQQKQGGGLPPELKPKFPKTEENPLPDLQTPPAVPDFFPGLKDGEPENPPLEGDNQTLEVPSKEVETPELQQGPKKKKKPKKPKKPDPGTALAQFVDDEPGEGNNAVGQFVDGDGAAEAKPVKKKEKPKEKPKEKVVEKEKDSKRDKEPKEMLLKQQLAAKQKQKQPKTESLRQKGKPSGNQSNRQKKTQGSQRRAGTKQVQAQTAVQPVPPAPPIKSAQKPLAPVPPVPAKPALPQAAKVTIAEKEPNEGFFRGAFAKAKKKILDMSKNPNYVPSSDTNLADETLIANEEVIKPEVVATYGAPTDYPKGVLPPKSNKNHPDKLFPGGRLFWMIRTEKPPIAKVIVMTELQAKMKINKNAFDSPLPPRTDPFTPYCKDWTILQNHDEQFGTNRIINFTIRSVCLVKARKLERERVGKVNKNPTKTKQMKITIPTYCLNYNRKNFQTKKQVRTHKDFKFGANCKRKKKKKDRGQNSITD